MNVNPFSYLIEKLKSKVSKSGDTMSGQLNIDQRNGTISDIGFSVLSLGNSIASGNANNSTGIIDLYSDSGKKVRLYTVDNVSGTKFIKLPNKDGTVALTSDFTPTIGTTSDGYIDWARSGNVATIWIKNGNYTNTGAGTAFYVLPSNLLPKVKVDQKDSYSNKRIQIETDGRMLCMESISSTILRGSFTYICQ